MTVVTELTKVLKVSPAKGEPVNAFVVRLAKKANNATDEAWEALEDDSQEWVNAALRALQKRQEVPLPEGIEALFPDAKQSEPAAPPAKETKAKPEADAVLRSSNRMAPTDKVTVLVETNPHRASSNDYAQFAALKSGMTVSEAVEAGAARSYIRYILNKGYISVGS